MDNYWDKHKFSNYFLTMANIETQQLLNKANEIAQIHLRDGFTQMALQDDVKRFANSQLDTIRRTDSETECQACLRNLQLEREYLTVQDRMLRSGEAALHASVQFVQNDKVWHWIINGVSIVLSGMQVVAGFGVTAVSFATGNIIGVGFGAMLVLHGFNGVIEGATNLKNGRDDTEGFLKKGYIAGAEFLGFDKKIGEISYTSMDLLLSAYGMARLVTKPQTYRLFYYLNADYIRGIKLMSRADLGVEIYNDAMSIKSIYDNVKRN